MIYAIRAVGTEYIKFGKADNVGKRLAGLDCACPHELHILAVANWPNGAESAIHRLLESHNVKGEWFKDCELARKIIAWMTYPDVGLARLQHELSKSLEEMSNKRWTQALPAQLTMPTRPSRIERRRLQREAWWRENGVQIDG